jgi:hypothetical protein
LLTPAQRSLRARIAAFEQHAKHDPRETTRAARAASPGGIDYWTKKVDPDLALPETERLRRADSAKRAHFARLALLSSQARSRKR